MKLRVSAEIRVTEDEEKVRRAILNIFPLLGLSSDGKKLLGESGDVASLQRFRQLLRMQAILDAARAVITRGRKGAKAEFWINKQAAFVGKLSFTDGESPLGPIIVELEAEDIERLIDYIAPRTRGGRPVEEISYP